jgi:hypothetical protein
MASQAQGKVIFSADAIGFMRGANAVKGQMVEIAGLGSGLKNALAGAFGAATITMMIGNLVNMSDEIVKGADKLDMTTDKFQALKIAVNKANQEMSVMEGAFAKIDEAARHLDKQHILMRYGITREEMTGPNSLSNPDLLFKMYKNMQSMGMSKEQEMSAFGDLNIKSKQLANLMAILEQTGDDFDQFAKHMKDADEIMDKADLKTLSQAKDEWRDIVSEIKMFSAYSLVGVIEELKSIYDNLSFIVDWWGEKIDWLHDKLFGPETPNLPTTLPPTMGPTLQDKFTYAGELTTPPVPSSFNGINIDAVTAASKTATELLVGKTPLVEPPEEKIKVNREKDTSDLEKERVNFGENKFLKIGGLMGVDVNTKLQIIQEQIKDYTKQIKDYTKRTAEAAEKMAEATSKQSTNNTSGWNWQSYPPY